MRGGFDFKNVFKGASEGFFRSVVELQRAKAFWKIICSVYRYLPLGITGKSLINRSLIL